MGAWGYNIFENDSALDFIWEIEEAEDCLGLITEVFTLGISADYLDEDDCSNILTAAAVIDSALFKTEYNDAEGAFDEIVEKIDVKTASKLKNLAASALEAVLGEKSELRDLWSESPDYDNWKKSITDIIERLK